MASHISESQSTSFPTAEPQIPRDPDPREVLDDARRRVILAMISVGSSRRTAAGYIGCSPSTITRTAQRDPEFAQQLADALHSVQRRCLSLIWSAAESGQWRAAAWLLERTNPDDFAKRPPNTFTPDDVTSMFLQFVGALAAQMSPNDQERLRQIADAWIEDNLDVPAAVHEPSAEDPAPAEPENLADDSSSCTAYQPTCQPPASEPQPACQSLSSLPQPSCQPPVSDSQHSCQSLVSEPQHGSDARPLGKRERKAARRDRRRRRAQARRTAAGPRS